VYNLDPAYGMLPGSSGGVSPDTVPNPSLAAPPGTFGIKVYIVGVGAQVANNVATYSGPTQDTGVFATYFPVK
jgi:hypothetical protein